MNVAELERLIESQPPGSLLPRDWLLEQITVYTAPGDWRKLPGIHHPPSGGDTMRRSADVLRRPAAFSSAPRSDDPDGELVAVPDGEVTASTACLLEDAMRSVEMGAPSGASPWEA